MKEKLAAFFRKLNNSYVIAAICVILIGVILLGAMIGLVARPFAINTSYTAKVKTEVLDETYTTKAKLVLLEGGRYQMTIRNAKRQSYTYFGDYGYGRILTDLDDARLHQVIWFENYGEMATLDAILFGTTPDAIEQSNPFKLQYGDVTFTNVGGIVLLVIYCLLIALAAAVATILLIKRKDGGIVFTNKMRLIKRLKEIEEMLGVRHDA